MPIHSQTDAQPDSLAPSANTLQTPILQAPDFFLNADFLEKGWEHFFPGHQGLNFEIGSGYGHFLASIAPRFPEQAFIGVDIVNKVLRGAHRRIGSTGVKNVCLAKMDALNLFQELIAPGTLDHLYIFFPDPWPKARHQIRRTLRLDTLELFARGLKPGGKLLFVSDDPDYTADAQNLLGNCQWFKQVDFPQIEVKTKYENKWRQQNKTITHLAYERIVHPDLPSVGNWQAFDFDKQYQIKQWPENALSKIADQFQDLPLNSDPYIIRLRQCMASEDGNSLRFKTLIAAKGYLTQHLWLELNQQGQLKLADGSFLPWLKAQEQIFGTVQAHLEQMLLRKNEDA